MFSRQIQHTRQIIRTGRLTFYSWYSSYSKMPEVIDKVAEMPPTKIAKIENEGSVVMKFAKLTDNAYTPTRGSKSAAGFDLYRYYYY